MAASRHTVRRTPRLAIRPARVDGDEPHNQKPRSHNKDHGRIALLRPGALPPRQACALDPRNKKPDR